MQLLGLAGISIVGINFLIIFLLYVLVFPLAVKQDIKKMFFATIVSMIISILFVGSNYYEVDGFLFFSLASYTVVYIPFFVWYVKIAII